MARRTHRPTRRLALVILALVLAAAGVVLRLVQVQIVDHDYYASQAQTQHLYKTVVRAPRGAILDRNGFPLATTGNAFDVYIDPRSWEDDDVALRGAAALGPLLNKQPADLITAARAQEQGDYLAARAASADVGLQILDKPPPGVRVVDSSQRFYPEGELASALLGFIGRDQIGLAGIEAGYDG